MILMVVGTFYSHGLLFQTVKFEVSFCYDPLQRSDLFLLAKIPFCSREKNREASTTHH